MTALGDAYRDLANRSGGLQQRPKSRAAGLSRSLLALRHLPFVAYRSLVRRWGWLPSWWWWFPRCSYQDWIVFYLLERARQWYRRAQAAVPSADDHGAVEAALAVADIEHQLNRWSLAHRRFRDLVVDQTVLASPYRGARTALGLGAAKLDEGALAEAATLLSDALDVFRRFQDASSVGLAAAKLGTIHVALGSLDLATADYGESVRAFGAAEDHLARTEAICALEQLAGEGALGVEHRRKAESVLDEVGERHYLARFPQTLLRQFRDLALYVTVPATFLITLLSGLALVPSVWVVEGEILLRQRGLVSGVPWPDYLILGLFAALPILLSLWLYDLLHGLMGMVLVRLLGRDLFRFEREPPTVVATLPAGVTGLGARGEADLTLAWSAITSWTEIDYRMLRQPIHLVSRSVLTGADGTILALEGVTAGYEQLQRDVERRLSDAECVVRRRSFPLVLLDGRWVLAILAGAVCFAAAAYASGASLITTRVIPQATGSLEPALDTVGPSAGQALPLPLTSIVLVLAPTLILLFTAVTHLRMAWHDAVVRRAIGDPGTVMRPRLLRVAAVAWTLLAVAWMCAWMLLA